MESGFQIFKGKTIEDLSKDIYENSKKKKMQIDLLIQELHSFIKTPEDALMMAPIIKEYFDVSVKNDEHLVKLAAIVQRYLSKTATTEDGSFMLTDKEKGDLIENLKNAAITLQKEDDDLSKIKNMSDSVVR